MALLKKERMKAMSELYENLLKATNNVDDITTEKYAIITSINGNYCSVKETDTDMEHSNIPIVNGANLSVGDKVIIGFLNNSIYDVVCYGALDKPVQMTPTPHNHGNLNNDGTITTTETGNFLYFAGIGSTSNKLFKANHLKATQLVDTSAHSNIGSSANDNQATINSDIDAALSGKQSTLISGTNIKTVNNESLLGSGNITIQGGGSSVDIVTSWESTPSDSKVASEKLAKDSLDAKQDTLVSGTNIKTVNSTSLLGSGDISIPKGDDGSLFWTTTTAPTTPNYTFTIANLTGETGKTPKKGDIIFYSYYRYTVNTVGTTTLKATPRQSIRGSTGAAGKGISSITKTGTSGLVDTYTITYSDNTTSTFTVTNGEDGATGATGNGISSVTKTGTSGLVDTYTITFTNGSSTTFTVTNGSDATVTIVDNLNSDSSTSVLSAKQGKVLNTNKIETSAIATSFGSTTSDSKVPSEKLVKTELDKKIATSNTAGLVKNDGTIDTNSYSTTSHSHNQITSDGKITSTAVTVASGDNIVITDTSDSSKIKRVANLLASHVKDSTAHTNIGSSANDTQATINTAIDTALSGKVETNDSRLSDARTPLAHTHTSSDVTDLIDVIYPVGSIYMSTNSTSPSTLFGGTWVQIKDTFLLACGDTYSNGATGGSADAIVVEHTHTQEQHRHEQIGSKSTGLSSGNYLRAGHGSAKDSKYTDYATPTINSTGESGVGKNMPPYLAVYVWERTA